MRHPLIPVPLWSRDSQIKIFISITWEITLGVSGFALGQQHLSTADLTPATSHLPREPRPRGKIGWELPSQAEFPPSHDTAHVPCWNGVSSPLRLLLGTSQPRTLEAFFGKCHQLVMSQSCLPTAPCEARGCPHGHLPAALCSQILLPTEEKLCRQPTGRSRALGLVEAEFVQLEPRGQTDTSVRQQLRSLAGLFPALRGCSKAGSKGCAPK